MVHWLRRPKLPILESHWLPLFFGLLSPIFALTSPLPCGNGPKLSWLWWAHPARWTWWEGSLNTKIHDDKVPSAENLHVSLSSIRMLPGIAAVHMIRSCPARTPACRETYPPTAKLPVHENLKTPAIAHCIQGHSTNIICRYHANGPHLQYILSSFST